MPAPQHDPVQRSDDISGALGRFEDRRCGDATRVRREARVGATMTVLESERLRRLRNAVVEHTPLFERFVRRQARTE